MRMIEFLQRQSTKLTFSVLAAMWVAQAPVSAGSVQAPPLPEPATAGATTQPTLLDEIAAIGKGPLVLHLPGIGGYLRCDERLISGLKQGGLKAHFEVYDWTDNDPGIHALHALGRNKKEAEKIAEMIAARRKSDPGDPLCITAHSGGCGLAVWALEKLPDNVMVDTVILMAPALSPGYNLTAALRHVRGNIYAFTSTNDVLILSTGTRLFGTIDGLSCDAAGFGGFTTPPGADVLQYKKLVERPYDNTWTRYDNWGNHIGALSRRFAAAIIAPLLDVSSPPTTRPQK